MLNSKRVLLFQYLYNENNQALQNLAKHSYNKSISDFLLSVLKEEDKKVKKIINDTGDKFETKYS